MFQRFAACLLVVPVLAAATGVADDAPKSQKPATVAHIRLAGDLDETPVAPDPLFGGGGENFKSKLDRIKKAQNDSQVQGLMIHIDGLAIGWAKMQELRQALA